MRAAAGALERSWHDRDRPSPAARKARPEGREESAKQAAGCTDHDHVRVYFLGEGGQLGGRRSLRTTNRTGVSHCRKARSPRFPAATVRQDVAAQSRCRIPSHERVTVRGQIGLSGRRVTAASPMRMTVSDTWSTPTARLA
jgi:hypothetical protein